MTKTKITVFINDFREYNYCFITGFCIIIKTDNPESRFICTKVVELTSFIVGNKLGFNAEIELITLKKLLYHNAGFNFGFSDIKPCRIVIISRKKAFVIVSAVHRFVEIDVCACDKTCFIACCGVRIDFTDRAVFHCENNLENYFRVTPFGHVFCVVFCLTVPAVADMQHKCIFICYFVSYIILKIISSLSHCVIYGERHTG